MTSTGIALRRTFGVLVALACIAAAVPCLGADWKRLDSPNFIVIGNAGDGELREVARNFEAFRETLGRVLSPRAIGTAVPTVVVVFASDRDFTPYKTLYNGKPIAQAGVCLTGQDLNYIAMVSMSGDNATRVIFHEYTHEMIDNVLRNAPVWFHEGLAEYYSTFETRDNGRRALIGRPIQSHVLNLRQTVLLPLDTLLAVRHDSPLYNEGERRSVFYAQSWALVHYLLADPRRTAQATRYLTAVSEGAPPAAAWREVFGAETETELRQYLQRFAFGYTQYDFPETLAKLDAKPVLLKDADVRVFLAGLLIRQRRYAEAADLLAAAMKTDPQHQRGAVMLAQLDMAQDRYESAQNRIAEIRAIDDWLGAYEAGTAISRMFDRPGVKAGAEAISFARRMFDEVRRQHGEVANALARVASLELRSPEAPASDSLQMIQRARNLAPGRDDFAFVHAQLLGRNGEFVAARNVLGPLLTPSHPPEIRNAAQSLMTFIGRMEENSRIRAEAQRTREARAAETAAAADSPAAGKGEPPAIIPVYRRLKDGEQRLEGTLQRIDCSATGAVAFRLQTPEGPAVVRANRMADVEFITYRDDLTGNVACGPLKSPMAVYVSWRSGKPPGTKQVVAIEFLPKPRH